MLVGHPFDTVKVRLQVQNPEKPQYRGTLHCFQSIIKQESVLGLYKGLGSPLMGLTFINALVFGVQGNTLRALGQDTPLHQFLAGAAAGAIQCVICCPMELAKTRLQLQDAGPARPYRGSLHCLAHIYRREGLRGVNRGMGSTLLRETPSFGVYFLAYDVLTRALGCEPGDALLVPKLLLAGGTAGILSWLSTYPVDVVKSRLQADGLRGAPRYGGFVDCVRQSYRAEGWRVFTRGLASTLLRAFPVNAATFATVTELREDGVSARSLALSLGVSRGRHRRSSPCLGSGPLPPRGLRWPHRWAIPRLTSHRPPDRALGALLAHLSGLCIRDGEAAPGTSWCPRTQHSADALQLLHLTQREVPLLVTP